MVWSFRWTVLVVAASVALAGCSSHHQSRKSAKLDPFAGVGSPYYSGKGKIPLGGGKYHVGKPYQVAGRWFTPRDEPGYDKSGLASWYGEAFNRRRTANGEYFDMDQMTAAHPTLPLPSYAKVTNLENGRQVIVRINDRGPYVGPRIMDMSKRAADALGYRMQGTTRVRVQYIGVAPINDTDGSHLLAMNQELVRGVPLNRMVAEADRDTSTSTPVNVAAAQTPTPRATPYRPVVADQQPSYEQPSYEQADFQPAPAPAEEGGVFFVQVGSFSDPANVQRLEEQLASVGRVQVSQLMGSTGTLYRVRVGPLETEDQANAVFTEVEQRGIPGARIIRAAMEQASASAN